MMKALEADDDLTPGDVMKFWQQRKSLEYEPQSLPSHAEYYKRLDDEKMAALNDAYYKELRGSTGMRGLWEWFNRNNEKQRQSQADAKAGKETGETYERPAKYAAQGTYRYKVKPWISWREVQAYVAAQESNQLMRPAKPSSTAQATSWTPETLKPFVRFQIDAINLSNSTDREKSYADYGFKYVFNMVDVYSGYSWQMAAKTEAATHAVEFVERVLGAIKERWGYSGAAEIKSDNGASFETAVFAEPLRGLAHWKLSFRKGNSNTPNQLAFIENSNREWRNIARRGAEVKKGLLSQAARDGAKPVGSRWHGGLGNNPLGLQLRQINGQMNKRQDASRAYESPARIVQAFYKRDPADLELLRRVNSKLQQAFTKRRGAARVTAYAKGDTVRLVNAKYVKADLRGNELKMNPRWSRTVYRVKSVKGTTGAGVPHYRVEAVSEVYPGDKDDDTMWYAHDRVQRILEPQEPPLDRVRQQPEYEREKDTLSGQRYYMNYGFAEEIQPGDEVDE
jgi:hypothetical protein